MSAHETPTRDSADVDVTEALVFCSCRRVITRAEWAALPKLGNMPSEFTTHDLDLRNCPDCHSTRSVFVERGPK